ncbi:hypothetical protein LCGC14_1410140 [marine sediment metagenome]|uniref:Uncharacterized protein n=1 Tax=marine sediment metagenome TaxID=412755 RepID=A0A0F9JUV0_9ZZZZ
MAGSVGSVNGCYSKCVAYGLGIWYCSIKYNNTTGVK